jgi:hypothetical protein
VHDPEKIAKRAQHVFQELGMSSFVYYLREGVVLSLEGHATQLSNISQPGAQHRRLLLLERLPRLRREMKLAAERLEKDGELTRCDMYKRGLPASAPIYTHHTCTLFTHGFFINCLFILSVHMQGAQRV